MIQLIINVAVATTLFFVAIFIHKTTIYAQKNQKQKQNNRIPRRDKVIKSEQSAGENPAQLFNQNHL